MIFGMTPLTLVHVVISLIGIGSGLVVVYGLLTAKRLAVWTAIFLTTTVLTSVTGFFFPMERFTPGIGIGIISLIVLAIAIVALYVRQLAGFWRQAYVVCSVVALYLNVVVLIVQMFGKIPPLHALAPTQAEPPFLVTQLLALAAFVAIAIGGVRRFRVLPTPQAASPSLARKDIDRAKVEQV